MKTFVFAIAALTAFHAQAGQEGYTVPGPQPAEYACESTNGAIQVKVTVPDSDGQQTAIVTLADHSVRTYDVQMNNHPGMAGAGLDFETIGFLLHLNTDSLPGPKGIVATLSVYELNLNYVAMICQHPRP